ncbi:MAG TPA: TRAP transporter small permease subunit [Atribacterota bacterium]|nr:TRAP transporter small permease subunit [Atribacterota bacterium]
MKKNNKDSIKAKSTALDFLVKCEEITIFTTGVFITFAIFIQVVLRYVFSASLFGLEEIALLVVSWFYFTGAAYSVYSKSYIKADVLSLIVKNPRIRKLFNVVSLILSTVAALLLFFYGLKYAIWSNRAHVVTPHFLMSANFGFGALVVGSLLMSLHFALLVQEEIKRKI